MSGLNFAFGLVVAVLIAASLFGGRKPKTAAVILIIVGWAALVLGDFTSDLLGKFSRDLGEAVHSLLRPIAGGGLIIGAMLVLLSKKPDTAA
ncbi:MAG: hypothetical protein JRF63_05705 [Deltaproteobacteria bacterium]|nr:hypothetical protein [Deltaproteobacteria bacterium]